MAGRRLGAVFAALGLVLGALAIVASRPATAATPVEGDVLSFGDAMAAVGRSGEDAVDVAATRTGLGWWAVDPVGVVTAGGDAVHRGDLRDTNLNAPIVSIAATRTGAGYWLAAADGGVFAFGDAGFFGSAGATPLNRPVVAMAATPSGTGYWLVASDGGVFTYGDARFAGSTGALALNEPIVAVAPTRSGAGYWLVAADGGVFSFGAPFGGSAVGRLGSTVTDAAASATGGYWVLAADGTVVALGGARHVGDAAGLVRDGTAVGLVPTATGLGYRFAVGRVRDVVTVWQPGGLRDDSQSWAEGVARAAGARSLLRHRANLDLDAGNGWRIPLSLSTYEPGAAVPLIGPSAAAALARHEVVLGRESARLRHAVVGSTLPLVGVDGIVRTRRVGAIVADRRLGWAEVALATADAASMGVNRPFAVELWGAPRADLERALGAAPPSRHVLGVDPSWSPPDPDATLANVQLKRLTGEVAYRHGSGDSVTLDPTWVRNNIVSERVPGLGRVTCGRAAMPALRGALTEVVRAGLSGGLGTYGGCYNARLIRGGDSGGFLSRHSYGIAIDVNTSRNSFGGRVSMDPRIVDIFRRWGFAWGGTWVRPDGMHFEYAPG
ncbi:MAG TPA: M15 family metallopeptidase [Acidimicrobiales bacterium]|nr:M15 family metallopeptidase [Acidimicrobiales bacterium]